MTGSAYAAGPGGSEACPNGSICLYYNSPQYGWGSFEHWSPGGYGDLGQFTFSNWGNGSGYGVNVGGNAAAVVNNSGQNLTMYNYTYNNPGSNPVVGYIQPGYAGALPSGLFNGAWSMYSS
ncbi:hypothetical protein [Kitasatospora kifunensis]|uniref:Peptidase inhibitor family I36 n=1 Tax=Kitasatospora kifunensis TaxID=58351 RepID=A0A7W7RBU9_KITKI|nr:hypothetical protein [Kitasatospora kifunensis]MBB4928823.1 hypothetical protein [Kitasatospora kifunensis]